MFEHGDGGKGPKPQLVLSGDFYGSNHEQGKLKRLWCTRFSWDRWVQESGIWQPNLILPAKHWLLICGICNPQRLWKWVSCQTKLLSTINNFDISISQVNISGNPEMAQWDFPTIEKMIRQSEDDPDKNHYVLKHCLLKQAVVNRPIYKLHTLKVNAAWSIRYFFNAGKSFSSFYFLGEYSSDEIDQWLTKTTAMHPDAEPLKKELAFMLLIIFQNFLTSYSCSYSRNTQMNWLIKMLWKKLAV